LQYPDLTYSQDAYDCRRRLVAGDPGIFKLRRRYILIVCYVADYLRVGRAARPLLKQVGLGMSARSYARSPITRTLTQ
jgi:hypothetical protein